MINSLLPQMELLLNLVWLSLAIFGLLTFVRESRGSRPAERASSYAKALFALGCVLVLLFPVVSASDDLHPTQAVLEDATKRLQQSVAPWHHLRGVSRDMFPELLAASLSCRLVVLLRWQPVARTAPVAYRARLPREGRSPPSLSIRP